MELSGTDSGGFKPKRNVLGCSGEITEFPGRLEYQVWRTGRNKAKLDSQQGKITPRTSLKRALCLGLKVQSFLRQRILEPLLQKLNLAITVIDTKRNSSLCFLVSLVPDLLFWAYKSVCLSLDHVTKP